MVSGSQATVCTYNDYSEAICSGWGRHGTLLLLTVITKDITQKFAELYCRSRCIYLWLQALLSSQIEKNNYISYFIMISNIFEYQYDFIFISRWELKNKIYEWNWKIHFSEKGGWLLDNGNGNWCMLSREFLCRTGHFLCRTSVTIISKPHLWLYRGAAVCRILTWWKYLKLAYHHW